jgi:hypothetical protein
MSNVINHDDITQSDNTDTNLNLTYTQIASCVVGAEFIEHRRQSLRAKIERERYQREELRQQSFSNIIRNLFDLARNQG